MRLVSEVYCFEMEEKQKMSKITGEVREPCAGGLGWQRDYEFLRHARMIVYTQGEEW